MCVVPEEYYAHSHKLVAAEIIQKIFKNF